MAPGAKIVTLDMAFDEYIDLIRPLQSARTIRTKEKYYKKHVSPKFGQCSVYRISYAEMEKFFNFIFSDTSSKRVRELKNLMRAIYDKAYGYGMQEELIRRLYAAIMSYDEPLYRALFMFLLQGRQLDEVLTVCWEQVDLEAGRYTIISGEKGEGDIAYEMSFHLYRVLSDHAEGQQELRGRVFRFPDYGEKFQNIGKAWRRILEHAGVEEPMQLDNIHGMIGFYATNFLQLPVEKVSSALGHTGIEMSENLSDSR